MPLSLNLAHRRYTQQAGWTAQLRRHIFSRAGLPNARRILDIGCGTGAVLATVIHAPKTTLFGMDIDFESLRFARNQVNDASLLSGDGHHLPFAAGAFDISFFHFVLLWLADPVRALTEARRVTRRGGAVIAFAEPDYSLRAVSDPSLAKIANLQRESLRSQGADPDIGKKLQDIFLSAGIEPTEFGQLEVRPNDMDAASIEIELEVLKSDLAATLPVPKTDEILASLHKIKFNFVKLQVPTYYCWGHVK
jgi:SAM-dependent methyltransferase